MLQLGDKLAPANDSDFRREFIIDKVRGQYAYSGIIRFRREPYADNTFHGSDGEKFSMLPCWFILCNEAYEKRKQAYFDFNTMYSKTKLILLTALDGCQTVEELQKLQQVVNLQNLANNVNRKS